MEFFYAPKFQSHSKVHEPTLPSPPTADVADRCRSHLERVIAACRGDATRLHWVLDQLQLHLPPDRWAAIDRRQNTDPEISDDALLDAEISGIAQIGAKTAMKQLGLPPAPEPSPKAASPSGSSGQPGDRAEPAEDDPPTPQAPAPSGRGSGRSR